MSVKIIICDDSEEDIALLSSAISAYDPTFEITTFTSGKMLVDEFMESQITADILFLDIYMPGINGIETAKEIRMKNKELKIIFLSSSKEYYPEAFEVFAYNYIIKPFNKEQLYGVMNCALEEIRKASGNKILIQYKSAVHNVDCRDIQYIESQNKLLLFYFADGTTLKSYGKLGEILEELPEQSFLRCHQSFIINLSHVTEMTENYSRVGQIMISISRKYGKHVKEQYYAYLFSHMGGEAQL